MGKETTIKVQGWTGIH